MLPIDCNQPIPWYLWIRSVTFNTDSATAHANETPKATNLWPQISHLPHVSIIYVFATAVRLLKCLVFFNCASSATKSRASRDTRSRFALNVRQKAFDVDVQSLVMNKDLQWSSKWRAKRRVLNRLPFFPVQQRRQLRDRRSTRSDAVVITFACVNSGCCARSGALVNFKLSYQQQWTRVVSSLHFWLFVLWRHLKMPSRDHRVLSSHSIHKWKFLLLLSKLVASFSW